MRAAFWYWTMWAMLPLYRLGWERPMGWANVRYCRAVAADAFRKYGREK